MTTQSITKQHQVYGVGVLVVVSCIVFTTSPLLVILIIPFEAPEEFALLFFFYSNQNLKIIMKKWGSRLPTL